MCGCRSQSGSPRSAEAPFAAAAFVVPAVLLGSAASGRCSSPFDPYDPTTYDIVDANFPPRGSTGATCAHARNRRPGARPPGADPPRGCGLFLIGFAAAILLDGAGVGAARRRAQGRLGGCAAHAACDVALTFPAPSPRSFRRRHARAVVGEGAGTTTTTYVVLFGRHDADGLGPPTPERCAPWRSRSAAKTTSRPPE